MTQSAHFDGGLLPVKVLGPQHVIGMLFEQARLAAGGAAAAAKSGQFMYNVELCAV